MRRRVAGEALLTKSRQRRRGGSKTALTVESTVTSEWQQIDLAWVVKPAILYLANEGRTQVGPDVVVGVEVPHGLDPMPVARIPAGESMRLCPIAGATFYVICPLGSGRLKVVAIPE